MDDYRWISNDDAGIKIEIPTSWVQKPPQPDLPDGLIFQHPDGSVGIECVFITGGAPEVAVDEKRMIEALRKRVTEFKATLPPTNAVQNGLKVFGVAGTARMKGIPVNWFSLTYGDGKGHGLLTLTVAGPTSVPHAPIMERITKSVQPIAASPPQNG